MLARLRLRAAPGLVPPPRRFATDHGAVAQLGERLNGIQEVVGSIPIGSTISSRCFRAVGADRDLRVRASALRALALGNDPSAVPMGGLFGSIVWSRCSGLLVPIGDCAVRVESKSMHPTMEILPSRPGSNAPLTV